MSIPTRPVLRWHGGKWRLAPWIISHFPPHRVYVEPFGGAASVLLRKPKAYAEVYNDLDDEVVTLFRVLRDPAAAVQLLESLRRTPFARTEFKAAYEMAEEPVERARRLIVRSFMGFGSNSHACVASGAGSTGFRSNAHRNGTTPARDWANYPTALEVLVERLTGVFVENRPALEVMSQHDRSDTLHYVDPPYLPETRGIARAGGGMRALYRHDLTVAQHEDLLRHLREMHGMVVLSGYPAPLYDEVLPDWRRVQIASFADGARPRTEVLWINPAACAALDAQQMPLFGEVSA